MARPEPAAAAPASGMIASSGFSPIDVTAIPIRIEGGGGLEPVAAFELRSADASFGGLSALFRQKGRQDGRLYAVSDKRAHLFELDVARRPDGVIAGLRGARAGRLQDGSGRALFGSSADAESAALTPDGRLWIGFERSDRILGYERIGGPATARAASLPTAGIGYNKGIEALAADASGALLAIAEEPLAEAPDRLTGWRLTERGAVRFSIDALDGFAATGADIGPDGALYLLERRFRVWSGVHMRLRRFGPERLAALAKAAPGNVVDLGSGEVLGRLSGAEGIDNMEGLLVEPDGAGGLLFTLVSDDNFSPLQRTILVQLRLRASDAATR